MFKLTRPCANCPFRKSQGHLFGLHPERLQEILEAPAFQCHKTVDYDTESGVGVAGDKPQQCAGLMGLLHKAGRPNQRSCRLPNVSGTSIRINWTPAKLMIL